MDEGVRAPERAAFEGYIDAGDAAVREYLASDDELVQALRAFDRYIQHDLKEGLVLKATFSWILWMSATQLYLAAVRTALSSHSAAVFPLIRAALESAAFSYMISQKPELEDVWTTRHDSPEALKKHRKTFTFSEAVKGLKQAQPQLYDMAQQIYDGSIDFGAHPNPKGIMPHVSAADHGDAYELTYTSVHGIGAPEASRGLCMCLDAGLAIAGLGAMALGVEPERMAVDLQRLNDLKNAAVDAYMNE